MLRAAIDTNVLIRGLLRPMGSAGATITLLKDKKYILLYTPELLEELAAKLALPRIRNKYHVDDDAIVALTKVILLQGEQVRPGEVITVCRDPKDNFILETCVSGLADYLVTTDQDLLVLTPFRSIPIIEPPAFLRAVEAAHLE